MTTSHHWRLIWRTNIKSVIDSKTTSLDNRLSSLNEVVRDGFSDIRYRINDQENQMSTELVEMRQNLSVQIGGYTCGGTGGWRRAVFWNVTDPSTQCLSGWQLTGYSKRTCGRSSYIRWRICDSAFFPISGGPYNQVCGRIRAYQWGLPYAFNGFRDRWLSRLIDRPYFSGVAVMHGTPRQHLWTFVAGAWENNIGSDYSCPCDTNTTTFVPVPPFVGEDYFCESGYVYPGYRDSGLEWKLHSNDTLWDGRDCHSTSKCCSQRDSTYFTKILSNSISDNLELRMCGYIPRYQSNVAVELYVKQDYVQTTLQKVGSELKDSFRHQVSSMNSLNVYTCGGTGGWHRAVYLDMTDPSTNCPSGWNMTAYNRMCGRATDVYRTCNSSL